MKHNYLDQYGDIDSFIHHRSSIAKLISLLVFIIFIVLTDPGSFMSFALYGLLIAALLILSKIPIHYIFKRSITIIPFVFMIAVFIPFVKEGEAVWEYSFGSLRLVITHEGIMMFWNILIKSYLSILCMILLISSTKFLNLLKAFERLRLPKLIIMIFSFMLRYIFVLEDELAKMKMAKDARSVSGRRWFQIKALSNMLGILFVKSYERGEAVYLAMCSRGFDGTIKTLDHERLTGIDIIFILVIVIILSCIRITNEFML